MKIRSSVKPALKKQVLLRGTFTAVSGALLILLSGVLLPAPDMSVWGVPILAAGLLMIAAGLLPYRRLCHLEMTPNEITLTDTALTYSSKGERIFSVPLVSIEKITHVDNDRVYGIAIMLKTPAPEKVIIHNPRFNIVNFQKEARQHHGCDLFLLGFTQRAFQEVEEGSLLTEFLQSDKDAGNQGIKKDFDALCGEDFRGLD